MLDRTDVLADLSSIAVEDADAFLAAGDQGRVKSYVHYFPMLYFYGKNKAHALYWERYAGSILVYQVRRRKAGPRMNLFLAPFPFDAGALRHALERMHDFNGDRSGRILWVQEGDALRVARERLEIFFKLQEFIFDRASVVALNGKGFSRLRQELSSAQRLGAVETRPYTAADQPACLALVEAWKERLLASGMKIEGYREVIDCLGATGLFPPSLLNGLVVEVDGVVRGFAFSGALTSTSACNFIGITDNSFRGLAYLLRYRMMSALPDLIHFNDSTDSGRQGLRLLKERFRPVEMHGLFGAHER